MKLRRSIRVRPSPSGARVRWIFTSRAVLLRAWRRAHAPVPLSSSDPLVSGLWRRWKRLTWPQSNFFEVGFPCGCLPGFGPGRPKNVGDGATARRCPSEHRDADRARQRGRLPIRSLQARRAHGRSGCRWWAGSYASSWCGSSSVLGYPGLNSSAASSRAAPPLGSSEPSWGRPFTPFRGRERNVGGGRGRLICLSGCKGGARLPPAEI